jgi:hypothetical protein
MLAHIWLTGLALCRMVSSTPMASADFYQPLPSLYNDGSSWQIGRPPRVRRATFIPHTRRIYFYIFRVIIGLWILWPPRPDVAASLCGCCSSGRDFAYSFLQIPLHSGHPCCSANDSYHQGS